LLECGSLLRLRTARLARTLAVMSATAFLASCQFVRDPADAPIPPEVVADIVAIGSTPLSPIYVRIFKEEAEFEVWKRRMDGTYALLETYPICAWSGSLGPKLAEGDRQAPEGFYTVTPAQLNPNSDYHLSFDIGFPNAYDTALGRTGSHLMVHGACSSAGCYSMTDDVVEIIYALVRDAFLGGQRSFEVHAFPFRMTPENMARHWGNPDMPFWVMLKEGYDHFEVTRQVPDVAVCDRRYVFNADAGGAEFIPAESCPAYRVAPEIVMPLMAKQEADDARFRAALAELYTEAGVAAAVAQGYGPVTLIPEAYRPGAIDATVTAAITAN
jgi:murein L,D-transpeptidase YafK